MPYSASDKSSLPSNVQKMSAKDQRRWVAVWNSAHKTCLAKVGDTSKCESSAFAQANGVVSKMAATAGFGEEDDDLLALGSPPWFVSPPQGSPPLEAGQ